MHKAHSLLLRLMLIPSQGLTAVWTILDAYIFLDLEGSFEYTEAGGYSNVNLSYIVPTFTTVELNFHEATLSSPNSLMLYAPSGNGSSRSFLQMS